MPAAAQLMSGPVASPKTKQVPPADRTIDFRVVDRSTGKPLPGVRLTVKLDADQTVDRTTDETGAMTLDYPLPRLRMMHVSASKDGFTPMLVWIRHPISTTNSRRFTLRHGTDSPDWWCGQR